MVCRWEGGGERSGKGGMSEPLGEMGKDFCPNLLQPFLENIERSGGDDGGWQRNPIFNNPHLKCPFSPSEAARTLVHLEGVPS